MRDCVCTLDRHLQSIVPRPCVNDLHFVTGRAAVPFSFGLDNFACSAVNLEGEFAGDAEAITEALAAEAEDGGRAGLAFPAIGGHAVPVGLGFDQKLTEVEQLMERPQQPMVSEMLIHKTHAVGLGQWLPVGKRDMHDLVAKTRFCQPSDAEAGFSLRLNGGKK